MQPKLTRPPRLAKGSRIALVAPSSPLLERDDRVRAIELCTALGFEPVVMPNAGKAWGYLAGRDDERLADLNTALTESAFDAVWCLRGGSGMNRILDGVDFAGFAKHPKPVIGYSDITALLLGIWTQTGVVTFHGPMARVSMPPFARRHFERVLMRASPPGVLELPKQDADTLVPTHDRVITVTPGVARGRLLGGCLSLLQTLLGTKYFPDLDGAILVLEDIGESLYRVDRMLAHLRMAGAFAGLAGVAIGRFTDLERSTPDGGLGFDEVLHNYFDPLHIPVAAGFPTGHIDDQWTLPMGVMAELDATQHTLSVLEAAVD